MQLLASAKQKRTTATFLDVHPNRWNKEQISIIEYIYIYLRILEQASEKASLRTHTKTAPSSSDKDVQKGRVLPTGQILQNPILYYFVRPTE